MPVEEFGGSVSQGPASIPVTPAQGGTGTTTVFTPGSVVFAGAAGVYSQDNPNFFYDATGKKMQIGGNSPTATLELDDASVLAAESLTNPNLTGGASWTVTGQFALAADAATYTHGGTNTGTLNQASGTLAIAGKPNGDYAFTYTISGLSAFVNIPIVTITTGFALAAVPLTINQAGTYTVLFRAAAAPGNFVINVTSASAGSFTMDTFSLKQVIGGSLRAEGPILAASGAAATPGIAFSADPTTGQSWDGTTLSTSIAGVARTTLAAAGLTVVGNVSPSTDDARSLGGAATRFQQLNVSQKIAGAKLKTFSGTTPQTVGIFTVSPATLTSFCCEVTFEVNLINATDITVARGRFPVTVVNKAGTLSLNAAPAVAMLAAAGSSGVVTPTATVTAAGATATINVVVAWTVMTPTTFQVLWRVDATDTQVITSL